MMNISRYKILLKIYEPTTAKILRNFCAVSNVQTVVEGSKNLSSLSDDGSLSENPVFRRSVPNTIGEYKLRKALTPCQPVNPHLLKVALLGEPNVGKSTLTNNLVKWKVCAVSKKVHTTRSKAAAILVNDNKQVVFLDTPGFVTPEHSIKHHLEVSLVADPESSVREADLIAVVIDSACKWTNKRINEDILSILDKFKDKKSILILNKMDIQKGRPKILKMTKTLTRGIVDGTPIEDPKEKGPVLRKTHVPLEEVFKKTEEILDQSKKEGFEGKKGSMSLDHYPGAKGWALFSKVFMVSALTGDGVDDLRDYLFDSCEPGDWLYHDSHVIDKSPHDIALSTVREKLLDNLPEEIPYNLVLKMKSWEINRDNALIISIVIKCPKERYKQIVIGNHGQRIAQCVEQSRQALQDTFRCEILLKLLVR